MKAMTLWQPWASLLACGAKRVETRSWYVHRHERIAIHAGKAYPPDAALFTQEPEVLAALKNDMPLPFGAIIAVASLQRIVTTASIRDTLTPRERQFGNYDDGRWAWVFADICQLPTPIPCPGRQQLWDVPERIAIEVERQRQRS